MIFGIIRKESKNVVSKRMMIRMSVIKARVLTGEEKTARVTSCLTLVEILIGGEDSKSHIVLDLFWNPNRRGEDSKSHIVLDLGWDLMNRFCYPCY